MENFLKFNDLVQFSLLDSNLIKVKDDYQGLSTLNPNIQSTQQSTTGLNVRIAATHSGIITRNNGFYLPDKMKKGTNSFIEDFGKPILLHHNEKQDNIGRVIASDYVDTSGIIADKYNGLVVRDKYNKEIGTIKDSLIKDFVSDRMPFGQQIDVVCSLLQDSILEDKEYTGLGHIQIVANIADPTAIQKLLDGRYLTGSVGATTNKAICSVCKSDWTKNGCCEHKPGGIYDSTKCFIIAGKLVYDEYSFVNLPADRHSRVLELHYNGIQNNVEIANDYKGRIYEVQLQFPQYDSVNEEDTKMKPGQKKDGTQIQDSTDPTPDAEPKAEGTTETEIQDDVTELNIENDKPTDETETTEETIQDFVVRVLDSTDKLSVEDKEQAYKVLWDEVLTSVTEKTSEEDITKLKLTDAKYNTLAKSQFCTSKCLFPVHDAVHITAAHRLFSGLELNDKVKKTIFSTLTRKAKVQSIDLTETIKLSKDKTIKDSVQTRLMHNVLSLLEEDEWNGDDAVLDTKEKTMLRTLLTRLSGLVGKDAFIAAIVVEDIMSDEQALVNEVKKLEETVCEVQDNLFAIRKEYTNLYQDLENLQDSLVEEKTSKRQIQEAYLTTMKTLQDNKSDESDWTSLTDEGITVEMDRLTKEVDMVKIADKLGDGLSRVPTESTEDPTEPNDNSTSKSNDVSLADLTQIQEQYMTVLFKDGQIMANAYIERLRMEGKLPQGIENIKEEVTNGC